MRPFRLARIAFAAESLRLRRGLRRALTRAVIGIIALVFFMGALGFAHLAGWMWLRDRLSPHAAALILAGVDLVLALILALLATFWSAGLAEREALAVRERAVDEAVDSLSVSALLVRLVGVLLPSRR